MWKRLRNAEFCLRNSIKIRFICFVLSFAESLRMYPPGLVLLKVCTMPFQLPTPSGGTYEVEVGTPAAISVYGIHHDPQYYPDPERYDPERFSEENKTTRHRQSYLPFGDGPRMCLGMNTIVILRSQALLSEESTV
jgi:Cytochrome P450